MRTNPSPRIRVPASQAGFNLVELMVALVAGLIVSAAVVAFTMSSFRSNGEYVLSTRLTQELRNSLDLVMRDLRRAGYDEGALGLMARGTMSPFAAMQIDDECILYGYDRKSGAGAEPGRVDVDNGEVSGLRRSVVQFDGQNVGVIEYAISGDGTRPECDGETGDYDAFPPQCHDDSHWCPLSDPAILNITAFTLTDERTEVGTAPSQVVLRDIGVQITGELAKSSEFERTVTSSVRVRSDCYHEDLSNCDEVP